MPLPYRSPNRYPLPLGGRRAERGSMSIGTGIGLFVVGAILAFAIRLPNNVVALPLIGYILMAAGVVVFIIGMVLMLRKRQSVTTVTSGVDADGRRVDQRHTATTPRRRLAASASVEFGDASAVVVAHRTVALVRPHAARRRREHPRFVQAGAGCRHGRRSPGVTPRRHRLPRHPVRRVRRARPDAPPGRKLRATIRASRADGDGQRSTSRS